MAAVSPRECFNLIDHAAQKQIDRLLTPKGSSERSKAQEIMQALKRLFRATIQKYPTGVEIRNRITPLTHINTEQVAELNLTTVETILDAEISVWECEIAPWTEQGMEFRGRSAGYRKQISLRTALNISRGNIFNFGSGTWGPFWGGKAKALAEVEEELKI